MRINKYLSENGYCSRRAADELVRSGHVFINGRPARLGDQIESGDEVRVDNQRVNSLNTQKIYLVYHKPVGVICTTDVSKPDNIISAIGLRERIFPVGRLDVESSGLIFLTNDGDWGNKVSHPRYEHDKEYEVVLDKKIRSLEIKKLKNGIRLREGIAIADDIAQTSDYQLLITVHQGWNRQIRRMFEALGHEVRSLKRVRIGKVALGRLPKGEYRNLSQVEINFFN